MFFGSDFELARVIRFGLRSQKIGNQERNGFFAAHPSQILDGVFNVRPPILRFEGKDFLDDSPDMRRTLFGRNIFFHSIGEQDRSDFVIIPNGVERQYAGDFDGGFLFYVLRR